MKRWHWVALAIGLLVLVGLWIGTVLVPWLLPLAVGATGATVVLLLLVAVLRWRRRRQRSSSEGLLEAIELGPLEACVRQVRDDLLWRPWRRGRARAALCDRPLYLVLGPSGVGKTTAFERAGIPLQRCPRDSRSTPAQGPRCEWWTAAHGALLEAPGEFLTTDGAGTPWKALLRVLCRARPNRPLNGVLVVVSVEQLRARDTELVKRLRARLDEALDTSSMHLPVYVLVTQADRLTGFLDFWADLTPSERLQPLGASLPLESTPLRAPELAVEEHFERLEQTIVARFFERLRTERRPSSHVALAQFPLEWAELREPLARFIQTLFAPGIDTHAPQLRGFYVVAAGPTEATVDGSHPAPARTAFFIGDVLRAVIFPDRHLATRVSAGAQWAPRELRGALAVFLVSAVALLSTATRYVRCAHAIQAVERASSAFAGTTAAEPLESARDALDRLDEETGGFVLAEWFATGAVKRLRPLLQSAYVGRIHSELRAKLAGPLDRSLSQAATDRLDDSIASPGDHTPLREAYDAVALYATLMDPAGHVDPRSSADALATAWHGVSPSRSAAELRRHAAFYLDSLASNASLRWPATPRFLRAREQVKSRGARELPYHWALRKAYDVAPIVANDVADAASLQYLDCPAQHVLVHGPFTAKGWEKIRSALGVQEPWPSVARVERWVLEDERVPADEAALRAAVRAEYFDDYVHEWSEIVGKCKVRRPSDPAVAKDEIGALKDAKGFYRALFAEIARNAIPDSNATGELSRSGLAGLVMGGASDAGPSGARTVSPVQRGLLPLLAFSGDADEAKKPAPLEKYQSILETLRSALDAAGDAPDSNPRKDFLVARHGVEALLDGLEQPLRGRLFALLIPPVDGAMNATQAEHADSTSSEWRDKVWSTWDGKLRRLFPFAANARGTDTVAFDDFRTFFQPDGVLWTFAHTALADSVDLDGERVTPRTGAPSLPAEAMGCLNGAREITKAFFGNTPGLPLSVLVDWNAAGVTEAKLWVGEKAVTLPRGQWTAGIRWNGESVRLEWQQNGERTQAMGRHGFSLFDLFRQLGGLRPTGASGVYSLDAAPLSMRVRSDAGVDVLRPDFFTRLYCPPDVAGIPSHNPKPSGE